MSLNIGLYNLEPKIFNTALMQTSFYHKSKGHHVEFYNKLNNYDLIYAFSLFNFTDKTTIINNMICGGTGFNIKSKLPLFIENCNLDYSIYPNCLTSYIWFSRGCVNNCKFCIVREKEGYIYSVEPKNINPNGIYITVMDNNFFNNPKWKDAINWLHEKKQKIDLQGIDVRTLEKEHIKALLTLKFQKQLKIAWDNPKENLISNIENLTKYIKPYKIMCYVLIGFDSSKEQNLYRIETLRKLKISPFIMPYDKNNYYQRHLARYVNHKAIFKKYTWEDYINKYIDKKRIEEII